MKDWSILHEYPPMYCVCRCRAEYRSHTQIDMEKRRTVSELPCPSCGNHDNLWSASSDWEEWTIKG